MPLANVVLFAPRYAASRLNVINPFYYARNAATAEGRIVLKQQTVDDSAARFEAQQAEEEGVMDAEQG